MSTKEPEPDPILFHYLWWNWVGIQTLDDCVSHLPWGNKPPSSIISHRDREWCYRIVTISFSLMLRQIITSVEPDCSSFSKSPFEKDYPGFWTVSKATTEVRQGSHDTRGPWDPFFPMGPERTGSVSSASHAVTARARWHVLKYTRCHAGLGTLPKQKIAVLLWYSALQLASEKGARYSRLGLESAQIKSAGHQDPDRASLQRLPSLTLTAA